LLGRRGAIRVRKPCRLEPAPARCTVRVANRGPRPVSYGGGEGFGARVSSDRAPLARWGCPRRVWGHTPNSGAVTFPGSLHRRYPGSTSDLRRRIGCSWRVVATCMYERVRRTGATGARLVLALGGHTPNSKTIIRPQSLLRRHPRSTLVLRRRIGCSRSVIVHERVPSTRATGCQRSPVVATGHQRPARARHSSCERAPAALLTRTKRPLE
jgi:hypothetical protein